MSQPPLRSVGDAVRVLRLFRAQPELGVTAIATKLRRPKSSIHRLLRTLTHAGVLERTASGTYRMDLSALELGHAAQRAAPIIAACRPALVHLARTTEHTAYLAVRDEDDVLYVDRVEGPGCPPVREIGERSPLHATSSGKAILSRSTPDDIDRLVRRRGLPRLTKSTLTRRASFMKALQEARRRGFAVSVGDSLNGYLSAAAPVFSPSGTIGGAITVAGRYAGPNAVEVDSVIEWGEVAREQADAAAARWRTLLAGRAPSTGG